MVAVGEDSTAVSLDRDTMSPNSIAEMVGDGVVDVVDNNATTPNAFFVLLFALGVIVVVKEVMAILELLSLQALGLLQSM